MMTTLTLCFTALLAVYSVLGAASERENRFVKMKKGDNFTMECNTKDNKNDHLSLYARLPRKHVVLAYDGHTNNFSLGEQYTERVKISGTMHKLTVRISDLQLNDSGLYIGLYRKFNLEKNVDEEEEGCNILLFVNDVDKTILSEKSTGKGSSGMSEPLVLVFALTACTMLVVCFLVMWVLAPKVKALCANQADDASREYNPVYEDMHRVRK
ncbi:hypothetical protein PGIGA_G00048900 [Pangasianodon gigas]|uniref:Uncharacterized protein n=1 Tax=Pangasianodon gigas TaxID=30993 RepID=A0ACC5X440_PANGG|nr:hypothetical protein [Pangasianodon gigas]